MGAPVTWLGPALQKLGRRDCSVSVIQYGTGYTLPAQDLVSNSDPKIR